MEYWSRDDVVADLDVVEHRRSFAGPTVYRVILKVFTNSEFLVKINEVFVWRRYSEFKKLHNNLKTVCSQKDESDAFPEFAKGKIFGRFEEHIVKERQDSAANFLKYVAQNPMLCKSHHMKRFFEGAVKVTQQPNSLSEEPTFLFENHDRLSVSGGNMDNNPAVDTGEEELEGLPLSQARGTWNDRQPTPDPLENNSGRDGMQYVEAGDENYDRPLVDSDAYDGSSDLCSCDDPSSEQSSVTDANGTWGSIVEPAKTFNDDDNGDGDNDGDDDVVNDDNDDDDDAFGEFEAYKEDGSQWLRKAFSVCSEGDDINQLASEAEELLPISINEISNKEIVDVDSGSNGDREGAVNTASTDTANPDISINSAKSSQENTDDNISDITAVGIDLYSHTNNKHDFRGTPNEEADSETRSANLRDLPTLSGPIRDENIIETSHSCADDRNSSKICYSGDHVDETELTPGKTHKKLKDFGGSAKESDCSSGTSHQIDNSPVNQEFIVNRDSNENDTVSDETSAFSSEFKASCENDSIDRSIDDSPRHVDSCDDDKREDQFSFSLDDKLKRRIQRAIEKDDYIYQSSLAMSEANELEEQQKYQASFKLYKLGIGLLLQGVKQDTDEERRRAVRRKTAQYLLRAENVYQHCLRQAEEKTKARSKPIRLAECRTVGIIDKIILVERIATSEVIALKVLHKCGVEYKNRKGSNPKGGTKFINSKYMVTLYHHTESSTGIHLFLEYIPGGLLWNYLEMDLSWNSSSIDLRRAQLSNTCNSAGTSGPKLLMLSSDREGTGSNSSNNEIPEDCIRKWVAEIVSVLSDLHKNGIVCRDLNPRNILIDENGHIKLTYFSNIKGIDYSAHHSAITRSYSAPEAKSVFPLSPAADWWSVGAILFELLTRKSLHSCYPNGLHSHSIINLPKPVSNEAWSLLAGLLRYNSKDRLGSGIAGCEEIKSHPFFAAIDWNHL